MALRRFGAALLTFGIALIALVPALGHESAQHAPNPNTAATFAKLPLYFAPDGSDYVAGGNGLRLSLGSRGATLTSEKGTLHTRFVGARATAPKAEDRLPGVLNVFRGPKRDWRRNIPTFERVRYAGLYPGVDAVFHGNRSQLEYDFEVAANADPSRIALDLADADSVTTTALGDLVIRTGHARLRQERPIAYQVVHGRRVPVDASFRTNGSRVSFDLGEYDRSRPLVIDPILSYSSYLGGAGGDQLNAIARGPDGTIHVAGLTTSNNFPGTSRSARSDADAVVTKLSADGSSLVYSNLYGGATDDSTGNSDDEARDIAVDGNGNAFVVGYTDTTDFPQVADFSVDYIGSCSTSGNGRDGFVIMISAAGSTTYSSCFGGNSTDDAYGVAVRNPGGASLARVAIAGKTTSTSLTATTWKSPTNSGADDTPGGGDGFVAELNVASINQVTCNAATACYTLRYRSFLSFSEAHAVAYDSSGNAVVTGTVGQFFSPTDGGPQPGGNAGNMLIAKYDPGTAGSGSLKYALDYGVVGNDEGDAIAIDSAGNAYVAGVNGSDTAWPQAETTGDLVQGPGTNGLIVKFSPAGAVLRATYVPATLHDIALQENNGVVAQYVVGTTSNYINGTVTAHNPIVGQSCNSDTQDTNILVVKRIDNASPTGQVVACLGGAPITPGTINAEDEGNGIAVGPNPTDGTILVAGYTRGTNWTTTSNGYQKTYGGTNTGPDGVIAKITQVGVDQITAAPPDLLGNAPAHFSFTTSESIGFACNAPDGTGHLVTGSTRTAAACGGSTVGEASYPNLADGTHTFDVSTADGVNSQSSAVSHTFTVDRTPPAAFDLQSPEDGGITSSTRPVLKWSQTSDPHGVSYGVVIDGTGRDWLDVPVCASGVCTGRPDSPLVNGPHTWYITASDTADPANVRQSATRTVQIGVPINAAFTIAPNPVLAGGTVTFDGSAANDATHTIDKFEWDLDGDGTYETTTDRTAKVTKSYTTPGTVSVRMRVHDEVNNLTAESAPQDLRINAPSFPTQVGVSINKGAQYTNDPNVKLTIVTPANTTSVLIANDGGFVGALPQAPGAEIAWKLDSSGPERLPKTVYVRFLLGTFASPNYTDDIILDERPPIVDSASVAGAPAAAQAAAASKKYKVKVKAHDTNSGVAGVQIAVKKSKPGKLLKYKKSVSVKLPSRPKFIRAKDKAGNYSRWKKLK